MLFLPFFAIIIYLGFIALIFYFVYRIVDHFVNKSLSVKQEQNVLLKELLEEIRKRNGKEQMDDSTDS